MREARGPAVLAVAVTALLVLPLPGLLLRDTASSPLPRRDSEGFASPTLGTALPTRPVRELDLLLAPKSPVALGPADPRSLYVLMAFPIQNESLLQRYLRDLSDPASPDFHHYLTASEFDRWFGGNVSAYRMAESYLRSQGVIQWTVANDHLTLGFSVDAGQADRIFHTTLEIYRQGSQEYWAPSTPPRLPAPIAASLLGVEGLSNMSSRAFRLSGGASLWRELPGPSRAVSPSLFLQPPTIMGLQYQYAPDFQVAYDEQSLFLQSGYPTSEVIATVLWPGQNQSGQPVAPFLPSDIYDFYNETIPQGEPHAKVFGVPVPGSGALPPGPSASYDVTGSAFENTLDLEMAGSTAPGASIYNVYGANNSFTNLDAAFSYILNPIQTPALQNVRVISNSWGSPDHNDSVWFQDLQEAQARGISVLAASGDSADNPLSPKYYSGPDWVEFPSSMAYNTFGVTAVGGVNVTLKAQPSSSTNLHLVSQEVWNITTGETGLGGPVGSTGGVSTVFAEPSWQENTSANAIIQSSGTSGRATPDLSALANNTLVTWTNDGYQYRAINATYGGSFYFAWGTSIASPLVAGLVAEMDHALADRQQGPLGFLNPLLYTLANKEYAALPSLVNGGFHRAGAYDSLLPALPFFDVIKGRNDLYTARAGYDLVTGWGSLDAYNYTMYVAALPTGPSASGVWGVEGKLTLQALQATSYEPNGSVNGNGNASFQANLFLANSWGAPIYWVHDVATFRDSPSGWTLNDTADLVYPFPELYPGLSVTEFGGFSTAPITFPTTLRLGLFLNTSEGWANQSLEVAWDQESLRLPVPGAALMLSTPYYNYTWQGVNYTNGPTPGTPYPGGFGDQFALAAAPPAGKAVFGPATQGNLSLEIEPVHGTGLSPPRTTVFELSVDPSPETSANLTWQAAGPDAWTPVLSSQSPVQGVVAYGGTAGTSYPVVFDESGLPSGTSWSVDLQGQVLTSSASQISLLLPNGTYSWTAGAVSGFLPTPPSGTFTVQGAAVQESVVYAAVKTALYSLAFVEGSLPSGTNWSVSVNGRSEISTNGTILFQVANGTYDFAVGAVSGYQAHPSFGTVRIDGNSVTISVSFVSLTHSVTFSERGLPPGTLWIVTFDGTARGSVSSSLTVTGLPNGTYPYILGNVPGWHQDTIPYVGQVTVFGANVTLPMDFREMTYGVEFSQSGLPNGTSWYVNVTEPSGLALLENVTGPAFTVTLPNGTYRFTVSAGPAYVPRPNVSSLDVNGSSVTVNISFTPAPSSPPPSGGGLAGLSELELLGLLLVIVGVGAVALVLGRRRRRTTSGPSSRVSGHPPPPGGRP
jgi:hypothetical protein